MTGQQSNNLKAFTPEERIKNLSAAATMRRKRADLKARIKCGELDPYDVLLGNYGANKIAMRMTVEQFIRANPGFGYAAAWTLSKKINVSLSRRLRSLGYHQREELCKQIKLLQQLRKG